MQITYDPAKSARNIALRGLSFERAAEFDWPGATLKEDARKVYPERRIVAVGYLEARLHVLCFTETATGIRVVSFRKANQREARDYEKTIAID